MDYLTNITIGVLAIILIGVIIWFIYSKYYKEKTENFEFSEPYENVNTFIQYPPERLKMLEYKRVNINSKNKELKNARTYLLEKDVEAFTIFAECTNATIQMGTDYGEVITSISIQSMGSVVIDNIEYPQITKDGDKIIVIAVISNYLYVNTRKIKFLSEKVSTFNVIGDNIKRLRFKKVDDQV